MKDEMLEALQKFVDKYNKNKPTGMQMKIVVLNSTTYIIKTLPDVFYDQLKETFKDENSKFRNNKAI